MLTVEADVGQAKKALAPSKHLKRCHKGQATPCFLEKIMERSVDWIY
jgi:hypothetical protein